ncbi:malonyl-ACP O-methyltransferase BioC [Oceanicoccus sagamiensis]|uniref:Malonyl-[acyl-carrier protein] O-methyltransferase n=1 Tax=Oceanicoccus sagamiensis TaxID=716816 RepID=A0A1X9N830_9GAMM|nr:malonyl-ACP O-methyltransferase BioC [Oceanicoccus sagamiensis]ARN74228.1 malonyl-[acyl-carrier protein] O-methyltransferase BioC [Oceanicoccus sagamiensis]
MRPALVLLHGWGTSSLIWQEWLPNLDQHFNVVQVDLPGYGATTVDRYVDTDSVITELMAELPDKAIFLGYSLGGMIATTIASRFPERVTALITLASNLQFVADKQWPYAMDKKIFDDFYSLVANNTAMAKKRFSALQAHGSEQEKTLVKNLRAKKESITEQTLENSLEFLSTINNTALIDSITVPAIYLFGENDQLVPITAANALKEKLGDTVHIIPGACHALFLDKPEYCWNIIKHWLDAHSERLSEHRALDKQQVARSFSRAATTYDSVADLQRRIGNRLTDFLPAIAAQVVVDLGCGTGYFARPLQTAYPDGQIIGLDLAEGMVNHAAKHQSGCQWLCGDAENLPLADNSVDIIFSSLAIQWCEDNTALFAEVFRVLKPAGRFVFATLGPNTLHELRSAWEEVDNFVHVNRFVERDIIDQAISDAGFSAACLAVEENIVLEYDTLKQLTKELKALGAHNVNSGRQTGLTGKQRIRGLIAAYDQQRNAQGVLPATYQTWYGVLEKPVQGQTIQQQGLG